MAPLIFIVVFLAGVFLFSALSILSEQLWKKWHKEHVDKASGRLEEHFVFISRKAVIFLSLSPFILAAIAYLMTVNVWIAIAGFFVGLAIPAAVIKFVKKRRIKKFQSHLIDTLMIFSSCLKGGLTFLQTLEVICEEMPAPVSDEFGLVLKENKLGIGLEDSLENLRRRMPLEEVNLLVSSVLVAKETGGNLPKVFTRLTNTIRNNIKLKEKVATLTLQGRLQGVIMSILPFAFAYFVYRSNPNHFDVMLETNVGRALLIGAGGLMIIGIYLIKVFSTYKS